MRVVSIGFRAKTGKAIAVALAQDGGVPQYVARWEISLVDPRFPETAQPHHHVMDLPWTAAQAAVQPIEARIEMVAVAALEKILEELKSPQNRVNGAGVVGSPDRELERIANRHMRAHAAEGILFRRVLEAAATQRGLRCRSLSDRNIKEVAASELEPDLDAALADIGRAAGRPWRADERAAAMAAWLML